MNSFNVHPGDNIDNGIAVFGKREQRAVQYAYWGVQPTYYGEHVDGYWYTV